MTVSHKQLFVDHARKNPQYDFYNISNIILFFKMVDRH